MSGDQARTIAALSTGAGRAALAVVRVSGPLSAALVRALGGDLPPARRAVLRRLRAGNGAEIDQALVLWLPGPASFTGEDMAEFHLHGGRAVVTALLARLTELGAHPAEPGAFTRRAVENGRLDLTQAEAIADIIDAETDAQRNQALRQLSGELGALYDGWRARLIEAVALVEAEIDFPDEGDVPGGLAARAAPILTALGDAMRAHLDDTRRGARVRDGFRVALVGAPNVGKSTLLNALAARDVAIVTPIAGTTRDILEVTLDLGGFKVIVADTAGLRESADPVEQEGVRRARAWSQDADLRIVLVDATAMEASAVPRETLRPGDLVFVNKTDLGAPVPDHETRDGRRMNTPLIERLAGSAQRGDGVADLLEAITGRVRDALAEHEAPSLTRARHQAGVERAAAAVTRAIAMLPRAPELAGEDLRAAAHALAAVTGAVDVEDILDAIFRDFCIGK